jgi:hypothetical protein
MVRRSRSGGRVFVEERHGCGGSLGLGGPGNGVWGAEHWNGNHPGMRLVIVLMLWMDLMIEETKKKRM